MRWASNPARPHTRSAIQSIPAVLAHGAFRLRRGLPMIFRPQQPSLPTAIEREVRTSAAERHRKACPTTSGQPSGLLRLPHTPPPGSASEAAVSSAPAACIIRECHSNPLSSTGWFPRIMVSALWTNDVTAAVGSKELHPSNVNSSADSQGQSPPRPSLHFAPTQRLTPCANLLLGLTEQNNILGIDQVRRFTQPTAPPNAWVRVRTGSTTSA